ncbi:hypothetical protein [Dyella solisilvae]|nr:hypothetical protein [Dyella solisilvae]
MSHWVYAPKFADISGEQILFDLTGKLWDLISVSESEDALDLQLRKYPGDRPQVTLQVQRKGRVILVAGKPVDGAELERHLDTALIK